MHGNQIFHILFKEKHDINKVDIIRTDRSSRMEVFCEKLAKSAPKRFAKFRGNHFQLSPFLGNLESVGYL